MVDRYFNEQAKQRQVAQLKAERKAEAERQRREAAKEAARQKPHCSSWEDPDFCNRVIARAERHAKALVEIRAGNYPSASNPTAQARWNAAVEAKVSAGIPKASAIMAVDKSHPGLRLKMLAEINKR